MEFLLLGIGLVVLAGALGVVVRKRTRSASTMTAELQSATATVTALIEPSDSLVPAANDDRKGGSSREARETWLRERAKSMKCRYCEDRSVKPFPTFEPIRPWFERVLRYFNVTPNARWAVKTTSVSSPFELCEKHHEQQLGFFEERIARERSDYSKFASTSRAGMYEFERYEADERALEEANVLRRGKKRTGAAKGDNVLAFPGRKTGTTS